ncbi:MAG: SDR family NAD(P)-dependent oxidoreductase [Phycisphaeraceae bacterium]|nr:SDR family NAD(P)-dependent oxidoreductase [Phycisphaeraceae bacterium]
MAIDLAGKPIAITGASSGIGAATAIACAKAGMPVALSARREDKLREVVDRITSAGGKAICVPGDVTDPDDCRRLIDECVARFGSIYAVYANAGYGLERPVLEMTDAEIRAMFETNFFGSLNVIRPAVARMLASPEPPGGRGPRGHVLLCSSCVAKMPLPYYAVYSATKAAQNHIGRSMNLELRPRGIQVSTVHPVGTRTEFFDQVKTRSGSAKLVEHSPDIFMQSPDRVARATLRCLRRPRAEVWTSTAIRLGMAVCTAFPGIEDAVLRRMVTKRLRNHANAATQAQAPR